MEAFRRAFLWLTAFALSTGLWQTAQGQSTGAPIHIRIAWLSSVNYLPITIARDNGIFVKNGLDVELVAMHSGPEFISAMLAGSVDFSGAVGDKPLVLKEKGQLSKNVVALTAILPLALVVRADLGITKFDAASMKGLKFGVTALNSATDLPLRALLRDLKLDPVRDVTIVPVGPPMQMLAALEAKQIDGCLATEPAIAIATAHKTGVNLLDFRTGQGGDRGATAFLALQATDEYLTKNAESARRLVRSILDADRLIAAGDAAAYNGYAGFFKNLPEEVVRAAFDKDKAAYKGPITERMVANMVAAELESGDLQKPHTFEDAVWVPSVAIWSN